MYTQDVVIGYYYKKPTNQAKRARLVGFCSRIIYISVGAAKVGTRRRDMSPASMKSCFLERRKMVLEQGICRQLV